VRFSIFAGAVALAVAGTAVGSLPAKAYQAFPFEFYAELAPSIMSRSAPTNSGNILQANPGGTPYFTGDQLSFSPSAAIEGSFGFGVLPASGAFDMRFLYINSSASTSFRSPSDFIGFGFTGPGNTLFDVKDDTALSSWEGSWRQKVLSDRLTLIAGIRSMSIKDVLNGLLNTTVARGEYTYNNDLFGAQVGVEVAVLDPTSPFQLNVIGKVGAYTEKSQGGTRDYLPAQTLGVEFQSGLVTSTAYAAEVGIKGAYNLTDNLELNAGYELLFIDKVALAPDNAALSVVNPALLRTQMAFNSLTYQGFRVGVKGHF